MKKMVGCVCCLKEENDGEGASKCKYKCEDDEMKWGR